MMAMTAMCCSMSYVVMLPVGSSEAPGHDIRARTAARMPGAPRSRRSLLLFSPLDAVCDAH